MQTVVAAPACLPGPAHTGSAWPGQQPQGPGHSASWCQTSLTPQALSHFCQGGPSEVT